MLNFQQFFQCGCLMNCMNGYYSFTICLLTFGFILLHYIAFSLKRRRADYIYTSAESDIYMYIHMYIVYNICNFYSSTIHVPCMVVKAKNKESMHQQVSRVVPRTFQWLQMQLVEVLISRMYPWLSIMIWQKPLKVFIYIFYLINACF